MCRSDTVLDIINKIRKIVERAPVGTYIYRGESEHYSDVSSNLYRFCRDQKLPIASITGIKGLLQQSLRKFKRFTDEVEELEFTDMIQHYGGLTNRIDFTSDYLIALFFACYGSPTQNGRVVILEQDKISFPHGKDYSEIRPIQVSNNRVISQKSIFVTPREGFIDLEQDGIQIVNIPNNLKRSILGFLRKHHDLSIETVYGDFAGVIRLQRVYLEATSYYLQGNDCIMENKHDLAIKKFNEAIKRESYYADAFQGRGIVHAYKEEYEPAIKSLNEAIEMSQYNATANLSRGNVYAQIGDYEKAIADFEKANYNQIPREDIVLPRIHLSLGNTFAKAEKYDEAIRIFDHAIQILPDLYDPAGWSPSGDTYNIAVALHYYLGNVYLKMGQQEDRAIFCFENGIKWSRYDRPRKSDFYLHLSTVYIKMNRYEKAIEYADKAIDPLSSDIHYLIRGNVYAKIGEYQKALDDFNKAIKELKNAISNLNQATDLLRDQYKWIIAALYNRYDTYLKAGKKEKASEDFNELEELKPELAENAPPPFLFFMEMVRRKPDIYLPSSLHGWKIDLSI